MSHQVLWIRCRDGRGGYGRKQNPYPLAVRELVMEPKEVPVMRMESVPIAVSVVIAGIVAEVVVMGIIAVAAVGAPQVMFIGLDDGERIQLFPD